MKIIEIFKIEKRYIELLKEKRIHMVAPAFMGLTQCSTYLKFGCDMDQLSQERFITQVNERKEVGTLFPLNNMTIFPYRYQSNAYMTTNLMDYTSGEGFSDSEFENFITDIFKAEIEYVKSGNLVIDVAGSLSNNEKMRFFTLLKKVSQKEKYVHMNIAIEYVWN